MAPPDARRESSAGHVLTLAEADYRYGLGPLRLRVDSVDRRHPATYEGEVWFPVEGVQLRADGAQLRHRTVLVRAARLVVPPQERNAARSAPHHPTGPRNEHG